MPRGYNKARTSIHSLRYHFIWCPKYRKKVLNKAGSSQTIEAPTDQ